MAKSVQISEMLQDEISEGDRLARTPLYQLSVELKAKMTDFAGWEMPIQYTGITQEHQAVRNSVGIFDISHMGKFLLQGNNLIEKLQFLVPSDLSRLQAGEAQYTVLLNDEGGILDDIIFYYQGVDDSGKQRGVIIVNAATRVRDKAWILTYLESTAIAFQDVSKEKILIALQGPKAVTYLQALVEVDLSKLKAFGHIETPLLGPPAFIARTGYTGEDGFEIMLDIEVGVKLWQSLLDAGVTPCGLGCRDTLRLEAAMALYGQDMNNTTTPLEAGLGWLVHLDRKGNFIGRSVLEQQKQEGINLKLVAIKMQGRHIARHGYLVVTNNGEIIGEITSGSWSPTLNCAIALAYIPAHLANIGQEIAVEIRGKFYPATVVKKPFYRSPHRLK